ncbi:MULTISPECIES: YchJ family protein [Psychrobacter]|jgi:SEC-C motif-containing protein|uniref:Preprotein translocase subunit SecA n=2 Tax=root TaxID=1 RepID=A0ABT6IQP0_9GAMM|nr:MULTISPECIES: YchJ family protein [Psychrobacter]MDH4903537.1 preprotein translocase subunit SecA [Psychrobacter pocilloporae]MEC9443629.1 YchJ family protein [Pseudomonadota bacterium]MED6317826.1 YchJ family protein [Pseudomonadota bacterium]|tara:strand:+ start:594 stop:1100 length:507 start_codon:yes stop_codon:yes gene_type:complete
MSVCPCRITPPSVSTQDSSASYEDCCQPYHESLAAPDAERLMRSRYSAFVLQLPDYIVKTTVPAQQALLDSDAIAQWGKDTDWAGLEIVQHRPKLGKRHAQVEFKAYFHTDNGVQAHHELSGFVKITDKDKQARWYFIDPTVRMTVSQKQPCICGSGEKFKRCCGMYL